jgi:hypothetical protein
MAAASLPVLVRARCWASCARTYGDVVSIRLGAWPAMLFNHPDLAEQLLVTHNRSFIKHRFFWRDVEALFGSGLLTSDDDAQSAIALPSAESTRRLWP